ncbi:MAG: transposase [Okeania sp. SIO2C9]|uniref:zinc ribbon domain-containing protein n=1 Tax=Okeania sp. SIO2C9 TaxID=2607791 RepID=UPI0013C0BD63|nr:transposase [Okeania sp. SIO2C9]
MRPRDDVSSLAERAPRHHKLASAIADCGFYEFKRQLTYKCEWYGSKLVIADKFYPSSHISSNCGHQQKMPLHLRIYVSAALR